MVGDIVRANRLSKGYTMEQLGAKIGLSSASISKIETGITKGLRASTIQKLSEALDIPAQVLTANDSVSCNVSTIKIPVFPQKAGTTLFLNDNDIESYLSFDSSNDKLLLSKLIAIRLTDNNLDPYVQAGDVIIIKRMPSVNPGEMAVICVGNDIIIGTKQDTKAGIDITPIGKHDGDAIISFTWEETYRLSVNTIGKLLEIRRSY